MFLKQKATDSYPVHATPGLLETFDAYHFCSFIWWREEDSNLRSRPTTDLQSVPFGHSGIPPGKIGAFISGGAGDGTRTRNLLITSQLLYQLSYASVKSFIYTKRSAGSSII